MRSIVSLIVVVGLLAVVPAGLADMIVNYTVDAGGHNTEPLAGLAAQATFHLEGVQLTILLANTSTGVPASFQAGDSLLVSLGMNLPGVNIYTGDAAVIGPGSLGLGAWSGRTAGDSVAEEWLWTNDFGGDLLATYRQIISTSSGQGGGTTTRFDGNSGSVDGPYGGMTANPPLITIPPNKPAVNNSIRFDLTLTGTLSADQLRAVAESSIVEYGSDARYLVVPEPSALGLLILGALFPRRR